MHFSPHRALVQRARPLRTERNPPHRRPSKHPLRVRAAWLGSGRKGGANMRHLSLALATAASIALATPAVAGPTEDFHALMDDYWAAYLKDNPLVASSVGVKTYDRELGELSLAEFDRQAAEAQAFLTRLRAIPAASLSPMDQSNRAVLERTLGRPDRAQPLRPAAAALLLARQLSRVPWRPWARTSPCGPRRITTIISRGSRSCPPG